MTASSKLETGQVGNLAAERWHWDKSQCCKHLPHLSDFAKMLQTCNFSKFLFAMRSLCCCVCFLNLTYLRAFHENCFLFGATFPKRFHAEHLYFRHELSSEIQSEYCAECTSNRKGWKRPPRPCLQVHFIAGCLYTLRKPKAIPL